MKDWLTDVFGAGVDAQHFTIVQVCCRAILMFAATLCIVRTADKRFMAHKSAFDYILGFILASMLARAINGSEQLLPTIAAGFVLAQLHRLLGWCACKWQFMAGFVKGHSQVLIEGGRVDEARMARHRIGQDDLAEELRLNGVEHLSEVKSAYLERNGEISVIRKAPL
jgi:uncharacterized membrane protein YcaP (DUF421 family)